jgi:hypothetical protein
MPTMPQAGQRFLALSSDEFIEESRRPLRQPN